MANLNVTFLDARANTVIAQAELPRGALPERLVPRQRFELKGASYMVVAAEPPSLAEAAALGTLILRLRALATDDETQRFTVPTLADDLPRMDAEALRAGLRLLELDGDEWRQIELYTSVAKPRVDEAIDRIGRIVREESDDGLFKKLYLRDNLGPLLKGSTLTTDDLAATLPAGAIRLDGILILGEPGLVKDGFAFQTMAGVQLYGVAPKGQIKVLCVRPAIADVDTVGGDAIGLAALCVRHGLALVDWCRSRSVTADAVELQPVLVVTAA